jgi:hypothetical protein
MMKRRPSDMIAMYSRFRFRRSFESSGAKSAMLDTISRINGGECLVILSNEAALGAGRQAIRQIGTPKQKLQNRELNFSSAYKGEFPAYRPVLEESKGYHQ